MAKRVCIVCGNRENIDDMKLVTKNSSSNRYACNGWFNNCASTYIENIRKERERAEQAEIQRVQNINLHKSIQEMKGAAQLSLIKFKKGLTETKEVDAFIDVAREYYHSIESFRKSTDVGLFNSALTPFDELELQMREEILSEVQTFIVRSAPDNGTRKLRKSLRRDFELKLDEIFLSDSELVLKKTIKDLDEKLGNLLSSLSSEFEANRSAEKFLLISRSHLDELRNYEIAFTDADSELLLQKIRSAQADCKELIEEEWGRIVKSDLAEDSRVAREDLDQSFKALFLSKEELSFIESKGLALKGCQKMIEDIHNDKLFVLKAFMLNFFLLAYHRMWAYFFIVLLFPPIALAFPFVARKLLLRGYRRRILTIENMSFEGTTSLNRLRKISPETPFFRELLKAYFENTFLGFILFLSVVFVEVAFNSQRTLSDIEWKDDFIPATLFFGWTMPAVLRFFARVGKSAIKESTDVISEMKDAYEKPKS